jgi:uncharacterized protein
MHRLTTRDLKRLDAFLCNLDDDAMMLSTLDGFLSGVIVCPELILPGEWLPENWGDEGPGFADEREANEILALIMERYNEIAHDLGRERHVKLRWGEDVNEPALRAPSPPHTATSACGLGHQYEEMCLLRRSSAGGGRWIAARKRRKTEWAITREVFPNKW